MKYIKLFELFEIGGNPFILIQDGTSIKIYTTNIDSIEYYITFDQRGKNIWFLEYTSLSGYKQVNKNPYKILSGITCIVNDFINNNNPDIILTSPMYMNNENFIKGKLNKRGRMFSQYFKHINGYKLVFLQENSLRKLMGLLIKNGVDEQEYFNKYLSSFHKIN